jgi:hypothetical protein
MTIERPRQRRSLTHVGGAIRVAGDEDDAKLLSHALDVPLPDPDVKDDETQRAHVHGFHTYPARMHPLTASRLVRAFGPEGGLVVDPFCGSGTVLVEALLAGRNAIGTDLNPLAVRLARSKTRPRSDEELEALVEHARACAELATERRKARAGATRRLPDEDVRVFDPHVLLELDSLRTGIAKVSDAAARADLELVLSALLVKLSKKRGDTSDEIGARRIAAGYPAKLFVKKTEELARRLHDFTRLLPTPLPRVRVDVDDATKLRTLHAERGAVDAIVTSPPYVATYDYVAHHALRLRWLGLDARPLEAAEMGARRNYAQLNPDEAHDAWARELSMFFAAAARLLRRDAPMVLLMADSAVGREALRADEIVASVARRTGFIPAALASQSRPHFHGATSPAFAEEPRAEHALLLRRV